MLPMVAIDINQRLVIICAKWLKSGQRDILSPSKAFRFRSARTEFFLNDRRLHIPVYTLGPSRDTQLLNETDTFDSLSCLLTWIYVTFM